MFKGMFQTNFISRYLVPSDFLVFKLCVKLFSMIVMIKLNVFCLQASEKI